MARWFYDVLGQEVGPLSGKELLQKVRGGEIVADTLVRKDDSQWVLARDINGLFESAGVKPAVNVCPYCGEQIDATPHALHELPPPRRDGARAIFRFTTGKG